MKYIFISFFFLVEEGSPKAKAPRAHESCDSPDEVHSPLLMSAGAPPSLPLADRAQLCSCGTDVRPGITHSSRGNQRLGKGTRENSSHCGRLEREIPEEGGVLSDAWLPPESRLLSHGPV